MLSEVAKKNMPDPHETPASETGAYQQYSFENRALNAQTVFLSDGAGSAFQAE